MVIEEKTENIDMPMKQLFRKGELSGLDINYDAINEVAKKISQKIDIPKENAKAILEIGIFEGLMLNRYRTIDYKGE